MHARGRGFPHSGGEPLKLERELGEDRESLYPDDSPTFVASLRVLSRDEARAASAATPRFGRSQPWIDVDSGFLSQRAMSSRNLRHA
jgi:hypothetical protein